MAACTTLVGTHLRRPATHPPQVENDTWVALLLSQAEEAPAWSRMVRGFVAAAERPGARTALLQGPAAARSKPKAARALHVSAGQPLAPLNINAAAAPARLPAAVEPPAARPPALAAEASEPVPGRPAPTGRLAAILQPEPGVLRTPMGAFRKMVSRLRAPTNLGSGGGAH